MTALAESKTGSSSFAVGAPVEPNALSEEGAKAIEDVLKKYEYIEPSVYGFIHRGIEILYRFKRSLKLGFTTRITGTRLYEWTKKPGYGKDSSGREWISTQFILVPKFYASNGKAVYFTDRALHKALEKRGYINTLATLTEDEKMKLRDSIDAGFILSTEFYTAPEGLPPLTREVVEEVIETILKPAYENKTGEYAFFEETFSGKKAEVSWTPTLDFEPREYQDRAAIELYRFAREIARSSNPNKDTMLWAPARSGKTMMAGWFLNKYAYDYEGFPKEQKLIVIASAMADVYWEWKETFESHVDLGGKSKVDGHDRKFRFLGKNDLLGSEEAIDKAFETADHVVVFLTLQDLSGSLRDGTKQAHKQLFDDSTGQRLSRVDYLIADECHHAVMSDVYGATIEGVKENTDVLDDVDTETDEGAEKARKVLEKAEEEFQSLAPKDGRLLVSATPLQILFSQGSKFSIDKNVAVVTPDDIEADRDKWYEDNVLNGDKEEYLSPYFGMIQNALSFAVNVGDPSKIFTPNDKGTGFADHDTAVNAIKGLFSGFSGTENKVPGFFVDKTFLDTGCGNHVLITLPRRLSCDIFETVLKEVLEESGKISEYDIFNISGERSELAKSNAQDIKAAINNSEKKTVTLTVNKMTTGVSVKKWDTVVVMTSGESIQHQIQIMGRVNTPWVQTIKEGEGEGGIRKIAKKQTTAVIHFSPQTLYTVRENTDALYRRAMKKSATSGGKHRDLVGGKIFEVSESGNLRPMSAVDVRKILQQKLRETGLNRIAENMDVDYAAVDASRLSGVRSSFGSDKKGGNTNVGLFDAPEGVKRCTTCRVNDQEIGSICFTCDRKRAAEAAKKEDREKGGNTNNEGLFITDSETGVNMTVAQVLSKEEKEEEKRQAEKSRIIRGLITAILIYSVVTYTGERSLEEIKQTLSSESDTKSLQAASILGLDEKTVSIVEDAVKDRNDLDYPISSIRDMMEDEESLEDHYSKFEKLTMAMRGMSALSANEIMTTKEVASLVIDALGFSDDDWLKAIMSDNKGFIDLGAKTGVFIVEIYDRVMAAIEGNVDIMGNVVIDGVEFNESELIAELKDSLYVVPTSPSAFVIIQRVFDDYGFNENNIIGAAVFRSGGKTVDNFAYHLTMLVNIHFDGRVAGGKKKQKDADKIKSKAFGSKADYMDVLAISDRKEFEEHFNGIATIEGVDEDTVWGLVSTLIENKFDAIVGNPPYQMSLDTGQQGDKIYQQFWHSSTFLGHIQSMVFMSGWESHKLLEFKKMREDRSIFKVDNYDESNSSPVRLFSAETGGVSIVSRKSDHKEGPSFYEHGEKSLKDFYQDAPENRKQHWIYGKKNAAMKIKVRGNAQNGFSGVSTETSSTSDEFSEVKEFIDGVDVRNTNEKGITLIQSNGRGKTGRAAVFHAPETVLKQNIDTVQKYKVVSPVSWKPTVLHKGVMPGRIRPVTGIFDTLNEAKNLARYMESSISRSLKESTPELDDYTVKNPIFALDESLPEGHEYIGKTLDERLYCYFDLTRDEISEVEKSKK